MSLVVMDASALLALLLKEPGAAVVRTRLDGAAMTAVNLAEVVSYYAKQGIPRPSIEALLKPFEIEIIPVDSGLAYDIGMLRPLTLAGGLSLGDRSCIALARRMNRPALTGERHWPLIAEAAGVRIELIR
jgi:PIN domain nuclease of toxin-antitoxin system